MRARALLREALATAWASKVSSLLTLGVVAAMCAACLLTVGRSAAAAADVATRMEQAGARRLTITDTGQTGFINPRTLAVITDLSTVQTASALGTPFDTLNGRLGAGGTRIPAWPVLGDPTTLATIDRGRLPQPGEAIIATNQLATLGLAEPVGYLTTPDTLQQYPIVGSYTPADTHTDLAAGALIANPVGTGRELRVTITDITAATPTVTAILSALAPTDIQDVTVESPTALADTARDLNTQLADYGRSLLLLILTAGAALVATVVLADTLLHRHDLGRRRTLGITRTDLALLVTLRTLTIAALGAVLGCVTAATINHTTGHPTPTSFILAIGILTTLAAGTAAIPPATYAARLDPVTVMRTP